MALSIYFYKKRLYNSEMKNNRKIDFWGSSIYFYNDFEFDEKKTLNDLSNINFENKDKVIFITDCFNYFLTAEKPTDYLKQFDKSIKLIKYLFKLEKKQIYYFYLEHISYFKKKEDFIFFHVFKDLKEFNEGNNNFILELMNWLSYNDEKINELMKNENHVIDIFSNKGWQITKHSQIIGTSGIGKSFFVKEKILDKNVIVINNKECNLKKFSENDKDFFYNLLISLTKEKNLNNFLLSLNNQTKNNQTKGIAIYITKKFYNHFLEEKLLFKGKNEKVKIKKI